MHSKIQIKALKDFVLAVPTSIYEQAQLSGFPISNIFQYALKPVPHKKRVSMRVLIRNNNS